MTQLSLAALGGIQLAPNVLDEQRGAWCSPREWCERATDHGRAPFDLDPFTNPRSALPAVYACMLERGGDGFGLDRRDVPGTFYIAPGSPFGHLTDAHGGGDLVGPAGHYDVATAEWKVWIQPPYDIVLDALAHYGHTRFTALLRLDTSTVWFLLMFHGIRSKDVEALKADKNASRALRKYMDEIRPCPPLCEVVMVPRRERIEFEPPPGVKASSNPYPHGLYYKRAADVPDAVAAECYPWPTSIYPASDPLGIYTKESP